MHLRCPVGALAERNDRLIMAVSTVGGDHKDNLRIESTESQEFDPNNLAECMTQYVRWKTVVMLAQMAQAREAGKTKTPVPSMLAILGMRKSPRVLQFARTVAIAVATGFADRFVNAHEIIAGIAHETEVEVYALLEEIVGIDLETSPPGCGAVRFSLGTYGEIDPEETSTQPQAVMETQSQEWLEWADDAEGGDTEALHDLQLAFFLRGAAYGRGFAEQMGDDTRFVKIKRDVDPMFAVIDRWDLRKWFVDGICSGAHWNHYIGFRFVGEPANPMFTDIAATSIAEQLDVLNGTSGYGLVTLKR